MTLYEKIASRQQHHNNVLSNNPFIIKGQIYSASMANCLHAPLTVQIIEVKNSKVVAQIIETDTRTTQIIGNVVNFKPSLRQLFGNIADFKPHQRSKPSQIAMDIIDGKIYFKRGSKTCKYQLWTGGNSQLILVN